MGGCAWAITKRYTSLLIGIERPGTSTPHRSQETNVHYHIHIWFSIVVIVFTVIYFLCNLILYALKHVIPRGVPQHHEVAGGRGAFCVKNTVVDSLHLGAQAAGQE